MWIWSGTEPDLRMRSPRKEYSAQNHVFGLYTNASPLSDSLSSNPSGVLRYPFVLAVFEKLGDGKPTCIFTYEQFCFGCSYIGLFSRNAQRENLGRTKSEMSQTAFTDFVLRCAKGKLGIDNIIETPAPIPGISVGISDSEVTDLKIRLGEVGAA